MRYGPGQDKPISETWSFSSPKMVCRPQAETLGYRQRDPKVVGASERPLGWLGLCCPLLIWVPWLASDVGLEGARSRTGMGGYSYCCVRLVDVTWLSWRSRGAGAYPRL